MARRLAAIMFTDLVGSTQLAQRDEKAALQLLADQEELARPILVAHHGRLVKSTGDGMLVEFGNALEAVQCAVEFQRQLHERAKGNGGLPFQVRIGIHIGDVEERGSDILGDAVNIAARVEPLADPGGIALSEPVFVQVRNKVSYTLEAMGAKALKGVDEPIGIYRIVPPGAERPTAPGHPSTRRLAVLPLANMSSDPENEYFADGMTEELISTISKVPRLDVISRTSVMSFKKPGTPLTEIGRQLDAGWILEGSVRKAGNRVRVTVQLIQSSQDKHLWAERYDRGLEDIFSIQSEIAEKVASELRIRLIESDRDRIEKAPTQDTEAHLLYLKGLARENQSTNQGLFDAIKSYEFASEKDPTYALAYAGLARCYGNLGYWEVIPPKDAHQKIGAAARKALELDPNLPEAHMAMAAVYRAATHRDFNSALTEVTRALELNPSLPGALLSYGNLSARVGRYEETHRAALRAVELDPLGPGTLQSAGTELLYSGGDVEEAARLLEKALQLEPTLSLARNNLGICRVRQGRLEEGIAEIRRSISLDSGFSGSQRADLVYALVQAGQTEAARSVLDELLDHHQNHNTGATSIAFAYARLGDTDEAFRWLEVAHQEQSTYLDALELDVGLEKLREDPRFPPFLERIGLRPKG